MKKLILNLQFLFKPSFWLMNYPYDEEWDIKLNSLMEKFEPVFNDLNSIDGLIYSVSFDGNKVWVRNYPYGYGMPYFYNHISKRPSRITILKLYNLINEKQREIERLSRGSYKQYLDNVDKSLSK
jgi:hypothetical protein